MSDHHAFQTHHLWMATDGNDADPGTDAAPVATLRGAQSRAREAAAGGAAKQVIVTVRSGRYESMESLVIGPDDTVGGTVPLTVRGEPGPRPSITGAVLVGDPEPLPAEVAARLDPAVRDRVRMIDLSQYPTIGTFTSRGMGRDISPSHPQLLIDDAPAPISRWPKNGWHRIAGFPREGARDDEHGTTVGDGAYGFHYDDERFASWADLADVMVHGYWCWDWANTYEHIEAVDRDRKLITLSPPGSSWGFRTGNRYQFVNVLEEISEPGEYAVDTAQRRIYCLLPERYRSLAVSVSEKPAVVCDAADSVRFEHLAFEGYRGSAVEIRGGSDVVLDGCNIRNAGNHAIVIAEGVRHVVRGCDIHDIGDAGIWASGGDRRTLRRADHRFERNHIYRFSQWSRCYVPAVHASGVGMTIRKNHIHDAPHSAIIYWGNEFLIEYNHIHHVTRESGDAGAIYTGRDFTARGTVIRFNHIHDTGGEGMGSMGIYWDDCVSGQKAYGNIFVRVSRGVMMGGGRELVVENNLFVDCLPAIQIDARGISPARVWQDMVNKTMRERLEAVDYTHPPYSERYPELLELVAYMEKGEGVPAEHNLIARNICSGGVWVEAHTDRLRQRVGTSYAAVNGMATLEKNLIDLDPGFVDRSTDDFRFSDLTLAEAIDFAPIPFREIGPDE